MAKATIPLALSKFNPKKVEFPALVSVKLDGVPVLMEVVVNCSGTPESVQLLTRSGETCLSAHSVLMEWYELNRTFFDGFPGVHSVIGELTQLANKYADFKDTGGIVRRQEDQGTTLKWNIFDYHWDGGDVSYVDRWRYFSSRCIETDNVESIYHWGVSNQEELDNLFKNFTAKYPKAEGMIVRNYEDVFEPNKRSNGYQKLVNEPMSDLWVVGVTEAVSQAGEPKGMVGGLVIKYHGKLSKASAGKLTHAERTELWDATRKLTNNEHKGLGDKPNLVWYELGTNLMAQIKHKKDDSYKALRQPTFQCWRPDKDEADG